MNTDEVLISKINLLFIFVICFFYLWVSISLGILIYHTFKYHENQEWSIGLALFVLIIQFIRIRLGIIKRITISPHNIVIEYFLISKKELIQYNEINNIKNFRNEVGREGYGGMYRDEKVTWTNGDFSFSEFQFQNYDALKNAIYNYMVATNRTI